MTPEQWQKLQALGHLPTPNEYADIMLDKKETKTDPKAMLNKPITQQLTPNAKKQVKYRKGTAQKLNTILTRLDVLEAKVDLSIEKMRKRNE